MVNQNMARQISKHCGNDVLLMWWHVDCLCHGIALDMNVFGAANWSPIVQLNEYSAANMGIALDFPDFMEGALKTNRPKMDIRLERGGSTRIVARLVNNHNGNL